MARDDIEGSDSATPYVHSLFSNNATRFATIREPRKLSDADSAWKNDLMRHLLLAIASLAVVATPALAAPCRDAKGHFAKCPPTTSKPVHCRNAKGQFAKCGTPGAKPAE